VSRQGFLELLATLAILILCVILAIAHRALIGFPS
jgi:hypothetical protein